MYQRNGVGLDWSTLFCSEEDKEKLIKRIQSAPQTEFFSWDKFSYLISINEASCQDESFQQACKIVALKFCIEDTSFARDLLSEEEFEKSLTLFSRKQYDSKLLNILLSKFCVLLSDNMLRKENSLNTINTLLRLDILRTVTELREQQVEKTFSPLKKQIDKIAAGVKGICYLAAESPSNYGVHVSLDCNIKTELNEYVRQKYSYDFNARNGNWNLSLLILSNNHLEDINRIFQKALFDDDEFWSGHKNFNILTFIEVVSDVNDARHAEKIIDHIFAEISKTQYGKAIIEKSLPLVFLKKDDFLYGLEWRTFRFTFERFKGYYDLQTVSQEHLCYPFAQVSDAENKLIKGKQLIEDFLRVIYPNDFLRILGILKAEITAPSSGFSCKKQALCNNNGKLEVSDKDFDEWNIQHIFDYPTFGYHTKIIDREAVSVYCQEYFFAENIWNRLYLKAYYMFELEKNKKKCFANLFEVYYDLFQFIEEKTGIKTSYQRNTEGRNEAYSQLETMLKQYGLEISEKHKSDYIISLLDRKVAIKEESDRFPVLEQLGDAIYGLAVAEMLFYNGEINNIAETFEHFTCAKSQIETAKKIGIDKLYLSSYSLPRKYESDILINPDRESYVLQQEREQFENDRKYIADSLEMIIGTICKDCGFKIAIDFTKKILKATYPAIFPYMNEVRWEDRNNFKNIDRDYWTKILPAPYSHLDNAQFTLWQAFDKFFKAYILETEDIKVRQFITNSFGDNKLYDDRSNHFEVNQVFYEYLHKGLESAIAQFGNLVRENYKGFNK